MHITQHVIGTHFHFGEETHHVSEAVSVAALVGLLLHTFVDGVAVASGLDVGGAVGALVFIAVILHKVPEGLAISSLFLAAGQGRRRALLAARGARRGDDRRGGADRSRSRRCASTGWRWRRASRCTSG